MVPPKATKNFAASATILAARIVLLLSVRMFPSGWEQNILPYGILIGIDVTLHQRVQENLGSRTF